MTDYFWPQDIIPSSQQWRVVDPTLAFRSIFTQAVRTVGRPGLHMATTITVQNLNGSARHRIMALIAALRGRENRIWVPDFGTSIRGSFPTGELLSNTTFLTGTTGWTASSSELVLSSDSGRMRLTRTGATGNRSCSASVTTSSGATYLWRAGSMAGYGPMNYRLRIGTTLGGGDLAAGTIYTSAGFRHEIATATGTSTSPSVLDISTGKVAGHFQLLDSPSFARCALVTGALQAGSALIIDALPTSTTGLLLAGDIIAIYTGAGTSGWEVKRLVADMNSDSTGAAYVMFEPPLRASPADNAPIAIYRPMSRFVLANDISWDTGGGQFSDFQLEFEEDLS